MALGHPLPEIPDGSVWKQKAVRDAETQLVDRVKKGKSDWKDGFSHQMAGAHLFLLSLTRRMYLFAQYAVEHDDLLNYLGFAGVAIYHTVSHHHTEETLIFPYLIEHGATDCGLEHNVESHHTFTRPMEATWLYLTRVRAALTGAAKHPSPVPEPSADVQAIDLVKEYNLDTAKPFDPQALQRHLDTWIPELMHHLAEEIGTLGPNMTEKVGEEDLVKLDTLIKERLLQYDPAWFLCSAYATMPIEEAKENLKLPMLVRRLMIPFWWGSKYWGMWLYCDFPENLTFAGTA